MPTKSSDQIKAEKARNLAYKKPLVRHLNFEHINDEVYEIMESCENIRYYLDEDSNVLDSVFDGDDEEAEEFKMMFSSLAADSERLHEDLQESYEGYWISEMFDDWFCAMKSGTDFGGYMGFDSYEEDYVRLDYENYVESEAGKRIERMTKKDIINGARMCFKIFTAYMSVESRYNDMKCAFDVIRGKNHEYLKVIKDINAAYEEAAKESWQANGEIVKRFDRLLDILPEQMWLL